MGIYEKDLKRVKQKYYLLFDCFKRSFKKMLCPNLESPAQGQECNGIYKVQ